MAIIMSGLVSGTLFPGFAKDPNVSPMTWFFLRLISPDKTSDFAKLLVWAFIAGFAEQFVPDTLDRLLQPRSPATSRTGSPTRAAAPSPRPFAQRPPAQHTPLP